MLGKRLKELRGKRTQAEIADHLHIQRANYSHYENGRAEPNLKTLVDIADFFGVSLDFLLGRTNESHGWEVSTQEKDYMMIDVTGLTKDDIQFIEQTVQFLRKKRGEGK